MLQQTTVAAVIPYYERFLKRFPNINTLAQSDLESVYEYWAGLGYYSRARNIHRSAQIIKKQGFPQSAKELLELPGFGPYISRAIASQAFQEPVGVLDGNVIRVLCRVFAMPLMYWKTTEKNKLQILADEFAQSGNPSDINQALMELGATVCTPTKPNCFLCPWSSKCEARKQNLTNQLPLKKPRRAKEIWLWQVYLKQKRNTTLVQENNYLPVLRGHLIFPGIAKRLDKKPKTYELKHSITHHEIYIQILSRLKSSNSEGQWLNTQELLKKNPSSLLKKILSRS